MTKPRPARRQAGQSVVEFALVVPFMILLVVAIADFGRMYVSAVAVEASAREAADFGSVHATNWATAPIDNRSVIVQQMERRACTSAAGSHLEGYAEPAGTIAHATCTNPLFSYTLEPFDPAADPATCADPATDPACIVHVHLDYTFTTLFPYPLIPSPVQIGRDSRFRMQDLVPASPGSFAMKAAWLRRQHPRSRRRGRGQALAEFALVAPLFFVLLFSIIDFGRYVYYVQIINNAAREGARYGIVHGSRALCPSGPPASGSPACDVPGDRVKDVVRKFAIGVIGGDAVLTIVPRWRGADPPVPDPGVAFDTGTNAREQTVTVEVTYQFRPITPIVPIPPVQIEGESTLVINN